MPLLLLMLVLLSMSFDPPNKAIRINAIAVNAIAVIDADATIYVIWPPT